jgi:hypothetical protein
MREREGERGSIREVLQNLPIISPAVLQVLKGGIAEYGSFVYFTMFYLPL